MTLLYKEMRLVAHPTSIVFAFLGCLVLVPSYPYSVIFMFGCLAPYITFLNARETNDVWYTAVLPVTKRESVLGKCLLVVFFQLFQLLFSIPFALLRNTMNIANNPVGLDATVAWYGFGFILYAVFDLVFLTAFYKSGYKVGKSFILAAIPMVFLMVVDHVALSGHQHALALPQVVGNMIPADTKVKCFLRYPEVWQDIVFILLIQRREHQHKSRDVCGG